MKAALIVSALVLGLDGVLAARHGRWVDYIADGIALAVDLAALRRFYPPSARFLTRGEGQA